MSAVEEAVQLRTVSHWIGGKLVGSHSGRFGTVWNPATGEAQAQVAFATAGEVDAAVAAAKAAFPEWRETALSSRAEIMFRIRELVSTNPA